MDQENGPQLSSAFPPPPPYYKYFTSENLQWLSSGDVPNSLEKRKELQYLLPPAPPSEGVYSTFADVWPVPERLPSLTELRVRQLYPDGEALDRTAELRALNKSALMNYLELVGIMGVDPAGWVEKIDDLRIIFVNIHHLLNEYRPHQARETLCMMMEEEIERTKEEIRGIEEACDKVEKVLDTITMGLDRTKAIEGPVSEQGNQMKDDNEHMQDVERQAVVKEPATKDTRKWFEEKDLIEIWNRPATTA